MKRVLLATIVAALIGLNGNAQGNGNAEKDAVAAAAMDYIVALYEAKPELIARSVHPSLAKVGFYKKNQNYIVEASVNPDRRRFSMPDEAPRHYIDLDHYGRAIRILRDVLVSL